MNENNENNEANEVTVVSDSDSHMPTSKCPFPDSDKLTKENMSLMRLIERLKQQPEFRRSYATPDINTFISRCPVYAQFQIKSLKKAYAVAKRHFARCEWPFLSLISLMNIIYLPFFVSIVQRDEENMFIRMGSGEYQEGEELEEDESSDYGSIVGETTDNEDQKGNYYNQYGEDQSEDESDDDSDDESDDDVGDDSDVESHYSVSRI